MKKPISRMVIINAGRAVAIKQAYPSHSDSRVKKVADGLSPEKISRAFRFAYKKSFENRRHESGVGSY
jgi:hypothetical protein